MDSRSRFQVRPAFELVEARSLPSAIIALMASNSSASSHVHYPLSDTSVAIPSNQGSPPGTNLALTPTGTPNPRELKREKYVATFTGTYTIGPGQFSSEAQQVKIKAAGSANQMLHGDIQLQIVTPKDPALPIGGVSAIFDRNLNSNSVLGFDLTAPQQNVDHAGRPNSLSVSTDINISAGAYVESFAEGAMAIKYIPNGKHSPGVISQGKAIVKIVAQIYTVGVNFILGNSNINP